MVILVFWLVANTIAAAWLSPHTLHNPVFRAAGRKWGFFPAGRIAALALIVVFAAFHIAIAIAVCLLTSVQAAVIVTSLLGFGWALTCYFLLQRFARPFHRTMRVSEYPALYPLAAFGGFVSSTLAIVILADWRCGFVPIVLWLLLGFFCAEIAIRREMQHFDETGHGSDRHLAIFSINHNQRRGDYSVENRYPFLMTALTNFTYIVLGWYYRTRNSDLWDSLGRSVAEQGKDGDVVEDSRGVDVSDIEARILPTPSAFAESLIAATDKSYGEFHDMDDELRWATSARLGSEFMLSCLAKAGARRESLSEVRGFSEELGKFVRTLRQERSFQDMDDESRWAMSACMGCSYTYGRLAGGEVLPKRLLLSEDEGAQFFGKVTDELDRVLRQRRQGCR